MKRRFLSIDPGFEWLGWSVVLSGASDHDIVEEMGLVRTVKSDKKRAVRSADDMFRRAQEIGRALDGLVVKWRPRAVCFESFSPVRSSSVSAKLGHAYGAIAVLTLAHRLPIACSSPKESRHAVGAGSKADVADRVRAHFASSVRSRAAMGAFSARWGKNAANYVHAWDSLGVWLACRDSEIIRTVRYG